MQLIEQLTYGEFYHVYNRGINSCNLFNEPDNYEYFLSLYDKYISPVTDTYAWVLMPNHFHLLVKIKEKEAIPKKVGENQNIGTPSQQFSKLFNSYAQAFNKRFDRHGGLFERPFKRKMIDNKDYLKRVVIYIHNNPVHHGFCEHSVEYPWSSYLTCVSIKSTKLQREKVVGWFDNEANFKFLHNGKVEIMEIEKWLEE
jgi:putative transposase